MTTPTVHELPIAGTTRAASLLHYPSEVLALMIGALRARPCLRPDELASLRLLERELAERRLPRGSRLIHES